MQAIGGGWGRTQQNELGHPSEKFPLILGGLLFLVAGLFVIGKNDFGRASAWLAIGAGMILYALIEITFRRSRYRVPALLGALAVWFMAVYWALSIAF